jgi:hypothetical protein
LHEVFLPVAEADIHRMTGAGRLRIAGICVSGKIGLWQMASVIRQCAVASALRGGNVDFAFIRAQISLGFRCNA